MNNLLTSEQADQLAYFNRAVRQYSPSLYVSIQTRFCDTPALPDCPAFSSSQLTVFVYTSDPDATGATGTLVASAIDADFEEQAEATIRQVLAERYQVAVDPEGVKHLTNEQRQDIIRLLNHPRISRREKTQKLLTIDRLTRAEALQTIEGLRAQINAPAAPRVAAAA
jgi:hypothetical protein